MGSIKYPPKHYNPNWNKYSSKRKLWNKSQKHKNNGTDTKKQNNKNVCLTIHNK